MLLYIHIFKKLHAQHKDEVDAIVTRCSKLKSELENSKNNESLLEGRLRDLNVLIQSYILLNSFTYIPSTGGGQKKFPLSDRNDLTV